MPPFSSGTFTFTTSGIPVTTATTISSTVENAKNAELATALCLCMLKDGTQTVTADIPMATYKFTGLGAGSAAGNSVRWEQTAPGVMTTTGDVMYASSANTPARLAIGTAYKRLAVNAGATAPEWVADTQNTVVDAAGDLIIGTAADTVGKLAIGTEGQVLATNSGATAPEWVRGAGKIICMDSAAGTGCADDTNENTLKTYTIPAATLETVGDTIHFVCLYRTDAGVQNKRIRMYLGATEIVDSTAIAMASGFIVVEGWIVATDITPTCAQVCYSKSVVSASQSWGTATSGSNDMVTTAIDSTGTMVLKSTAQQAATTALNAIIQDYFFVEYLKYVAP